MADSDFLLDGLPKGQAWLNGRRRATVAFALEAYARLADDRDMPPQDQKMLRVMIGIIRTTRLELSNPLGVDTYLANPSRYHGAAG
jgi:hypothetical protein